MTSGVVATQRLTWMDCCGTVSQLMEVNSRHAEDDNKCSLLNYSRRRMIRAALQNHLRTIKTDLDLVPEEEQDEEADRACLRQLDEEVEERRRSMMESPSCHDKSHRDLQSCNLDGIHEDECGLDANFIPDDDSENSDTSAAFDSAVSPVGNDILLPEEVQKLQQEQVRQLQLQLQPQQQVSRNAVRTMMAAQGVTEEEVSLTQNDITSSALAQVVRRPEEMREALNTLAAVVRRSLICMGAAYTSYLDGSQHTSLSKLDAYNAQHASVAEDPTFSTDQLRRAMEQYDAARRELEQHRMQNEFTYATRVQPGQNAYYPAQGSDMQHDRTVADVKQKLLDNVSRACMACTAIRSLYNQRALEHARQNGHCCA